MTDASERRLLLLRPETGMDLSGDEAPRRRASHGWAGRNFARRGTVVQAYLDPGYAPGAGPGDATDRRVPA
jgi:hypothetical protein